MRWLPRGAGARKPAATGTHSALCLIRSDSSAKVHTRQCGSSPRSGREPGDLSAKLPLGVPCRVSSDRDRCCLCPPSGSQGWVSPPGGLPAQSPPSPPSVAPLEVMGEEGGREGVRNWRLTVRISLCIVPINFHTAWCSDDAAGSHGMVILYKSSSLVESARCFPPKDIS